MHHYGTETSLSIMHMVEIQRLFQLQIPELALREPQLMRGLSKFLSIPQTSVVSA
jgi:hypothetical protein